MNVSNTLYLSDQESFSGLFYKPSYARLPPAKRVECLMFNVSGSCVYLVLKYVVMEVFTTSRNHGPLCKLN